MSDFIKNINKIRARTSKNQFFSLGLRAKLRIKVEIARCPLSTSRAIFEQAKLAYIPSRATRCRILRTMSNVRNATKRPPLTDAHKTRRLDWAHEYMKQDFGHVIFTDECRATLDGPDGFSRGWILDGHNAPIRLSRQQGGGGVMFWAGIFGDKLVGPFKLDKGVKMNSAVYSEFLETHYIPWEESLPLAVSKNLVFMQDNAPSHASKYTSQFLTGHNISGARLMKWPAASPDINPIENYWSLIKSIVYKSGTQYSNNESLWQGIQDGAAQIPPETIKKLTTSVDNRLVMILRKQGGYIYH